MFIEEEALDDENDGNVNKEGTMDDSLLLDQYVLDSFINDDTINSPSPDRDKVKGQG